MGTKKPPRSHRVRNDGTWVDRSTPGDRELIAKGRQLELAAQQAEMEAKTAARRHYLRMQTWVLLGVGTLTLHAMVTRVHDVWMNLINPGSATALEGTTLPIRHGAAANNVSAFDRVGANINPVRDQAGGGNHIRPIRRDKRR